ncbi:MAG: hypothetical protein AAFR61_24340, partial [Bacteroidota bacterium]
AQGNHFRLGVATACSCGRSIQRQQDPSPQLQAAATVSHRTLPRQQPPRSNIPAPTKKGCPGRQPFHYIFRLA